MVTFEPYYDSYAACIALAGAGRRVVTLRPDGGRWTFDPAELRAAINADPADPAQQPAQPDRHRVHRATNWP